MDADSKRQKLRWDYTEISGRKNGDKNERENDSPSNEPYRAFPELAQVVYKRIH